MVLLNVKPGYYSAFTTYLTRTVVNASWSDNASDITRSMYWLPIRQRIYFKIGLFALRATFILARQSSKPQPARQLRSSSTHQFQRSAVTSTFASRVFSVSVPSVSIH